MWWALYVYGFMIAKKLLVLPPALRLLILLSSAVTLVVFAAVAAKGFSADDDARGLLATALAVCGLAGFLAPWSLGRRGPHRGSDHRERSS